MELVKGSLHLERHQENKKGGGWGEAELTGSMGTWF